LPAPTTIVVGDDVQAKKPDPEAYLLALQRLSLSAHDCCVIEDSRNGLLAAGGAGLAVAIVRSEFFADETFEGAKVVVDELVELVELLV
jgi:beta-phosphoglucomutase-like phosphatase (HAD superfamily)